MQDEIADLVFPIFDRALALRDRLENGERPSLEIEQAAFKNMLLTDIEARRWIEYGGEGPRTSTATAGTADGEDNRYLGIRFALVCWLDELFILYSPWSREWNERKLEGSLYGTNDRAWRFWQQAGLAEARAGSDALEVYFLCVMLGFRGELAEEPDKLTNWVEAMRTRVQPRGAWRGPPELEPPTHVPPLRAREKLQKFVMVSGILLLAMIPFVVFFVVRHLTQ